MLRVFAKKSFVYFFGMMLNRGLALLLVPIYTAFLKPEDYGVLAVCNTTAIILGQFLLLSLDGAVVLYRFKLEEREYRKFMATLWLAVTILPLTVLLLLNQIGNYYGSSIFVSVPWHPYLTLSLWIALTVGIQQVAVGVFRAKEQPFQYTAFNFFAAFITAAFAVYFVAIAKLGVLGTLYGQLLGGLLLGMVAHFVVVRSFWPFIGFAWQHLKSAFLLYLPLLPHGICIWLLNLSDRWILERYVPLADLGIYNLAYTIGMILLSIGGAQALTFTPMYFKNSGDQEFRARLPHLLIMFALVPMFLGFCLAVLAPEILAIMTRPAYYRAATIVPWVVLAYWFYVAIYQPHLAVIEYHQKTIWVLCVSAPAAILNIGLNLIFAPQYGILAAALSTTGCFALMAAVAVFFASRLERLPMPWMKLLQIFTGCVMVYLVSYFWITPYGIQASLIIKSVLLIVAGIIFVLVSGIPLGGLKDLAAPRRKGFVKP